MTFGEKLKQLRLRTSLTMKEFCAKHGLDPGNCSKIERGIMIPQTYHAFLMWGKFVGLKKGSKAMSEFCDLGCAEIGRIPPDLMENKEFVTYLPTLFALVRNNGMKVFNGE